MLGLFFEPFAQYAVSISKNMTELVQKNIFSRAIFVIGTFTLIYIVTGCSTQTQTAANDRITAAQARLNKIQNAGPIAPSESKLLVTDDIPRFTSRSIPMERSNVLPPNIQTVTLRLPGRHNLSTIADILSRAIGIPVIMQADALMSPLLFAPMNGGALGGKTNADALNEESLAAAQLMQIGASRINLNPEQANTTFELNYSGTLQGLLDQIASQAQLQWVFQDNTIVFRRIVTRSITLKIIPGNIKTSVQTTGPGGGIDSSTEADLLANIEKTLALLISSQGQLTVNKSIGQITVRDAIANVREVERYLNQIQAQLLRQVSIKVEVLQVDVTAEAQNEISWSNLSKDVAGLGNLALLSSPSGNSASTSSPVSLGITNGDSSVFVKALEKYGRVSSTYSTVVNTLHRQAVPVMVTNNITYVRSVTAPTTNANGTLVGPSINVAELVTGFSVSLMPIVLDSNRILLQSSLGLNSLRAMKIFSVGSGANQVSVQQPDVDIVGGIQRTNLRSGETMILLGYNYEDARATNTDAIKETLPISKATTSSKKTVVILVTPQILDF